MGHSAGAPKSEPQRCLERKSGGFRSQAVPRALQFKTLQGPGGRDTNVAGGGWRSTGSGNGRRGAQTRTLEIGLGGAGGGGVANPGVGWRGERDAWSGVGVAADDRSGPGADWLQCQVRGLLAVAPGGGSKWLWGACGSEVLPSLLT
ncbi:hypothetical protein NDU88_007262 [Pleurodeles waltl]|uniref:Uncharacterized protein n=1 Tax=Pleurodeles waltl TaxID=8319 RepID=A0AAV7NSL6_PLEWA|nr:hypothetical protein NDU88_007262 [Pleurodeles waltl]